MKLNLVGGKVARVTVRIFEARHVISVVVAIIKVWRAIVVRVKVWEGVVFFI